MRQHKLAYLGVVFGLIVVTAVVLWFTVDRQTAIEEAYEATPVGTIGDDGRSLWIDGPGEAMLFTDEGFDVYLHTETILHSLDMPDYIQEQINGTTAMMGRQQASWDRFSITWTYHPDNGLDLTVYEED